MSGIGATETEKISIHAPHTGGDAAILPKSLKASYFNPRPPYGRRRDKPKENADSSDISIHAPHTGGDTLVTQIGILDIQFQSTPPIREATV